MNMTKDVVSPNPMSPDFEFSLTAAAPVEPSRKRASNDATMQAPISAAEAQALCMKDSAIGG